MYRLMLLALLTLVMGLSLVVNKSSTTEAAGNEWRQLLPEAQGIGYIDHKGALHTVTLECQIVEIRINHGEGWLIRYTLDGRSVTDRLGPDLGQLIVGPLCL